jgi:gamma-glutamyltranspeptidase/glutathione hydrolase
MTAVTEQHQAGLGGDAYILAWLSGPQKLVFINGTGPSPKLATPEFYRKRFAGIPLDGPFSTNVPGSVAAFDLALKRYGTKGYSALLADAIEAAEKGHAMTHFAAQNHASALDLLRRYPSSVQVLLKNGRPFEPGDLFVQPDLARTLKTIAREGADVFYRGRLAEMTVATYRKYEGLLRLDDLAAFHAEEAEPVRTDYKGYTIYEAGANSQGLVLLLAMNIVKDIDLKALGYNSRVSARADRSIEARLCGSRSVHLDPRFRAIPSAGLLSAEYAAARRKLIRSDHAIRGTAPPGDPIRGARSWKAGQSAMKIVRSRLRWPLTARWIMARPPLFYRGSLW